MKKGFAKVLSLSLATVMLLSGCSSTSDTSDGTSDGTTSAYDTMVVRAMGDPLSWNPDTTADDNLYSIAQNMYLRLTKLDATHQVIPDLASDWSFSDDGLTLTFNLTEGYTWSDGEAVTSSDVKYTFDYIKENDTCYFSASMGIVDSIDAPDDYTVVFNMNTVDVSFPSMLGWYGTFIMAEHVYNVDGVAWEDNDAAKTSPVTAGAYTLSDYVVGERISLVADENAYVDAKIDNLVYSIITDDDTAVQALKNGEIDFLESVPNAYIDELTADENIDMDLNVYPSPVRIIFNMNDETISDLAVREAISYCIDRADISTKATSGVMLPEYAFYPSLIEWASNQDDVAPEQDLAEAEQILIDAGYTKDADGYYVTGLSIKAFSFAPYADVATLIADACDSIGIEVAVDAVEYSAWQDAVYAGDFTMELQGGYMGPDPAALKNRLSTGASSNLGFYSNTEFDELVTEAGTVSDEEQRAALYYEAQTILSEDLPYLPILSYVSYDASYAKIENLPLEGAGQWGWAEYAYAYFTE